MVLNVSKDEWISLEFDVKIKRREIGVELSTECWSH
jgi:hypothetical protein